MKLKRLSAWILGGAFLICFSGCRLGNHSDSPASTTKSQFANSELFFTDIKGFDTYVFYQDSAHLTDAQNLHSPFVSIPTHLLTVFTSPLYWNTLDDATHAQIFMDSFKSDYEETLVDAAGNIGIEFNSSVTPLITNSICKTQVKTIHEGELNRAVPGSALLSGSSTRQNVAGRLKLDYTSIRVFSGDCTDSLRELATCYQDGAGCSNEQLSEAHALFDLYVRGSGILSINDASKIKGLAYVVHFD